MRQLCYCSRNTWRSLTIKVVRSWKNICDKNNKSKKSYKKTRKAKKGNNLLLYRSLHPVTAQGIDSKSNLYWLVNDENKPFQENTAILLEKHLLQFVVHRNLLYASHVFYFDPHYLSFVHYLCTALSFVKLIMPIEVFICVDSFCKQKVYNKWYKFKMYVN